MNEQVCLPGSVNEWVPLTNFKTFIVREQAAEEFMNVNNCVRDCGQSIDAIISDLKTIKTKMGENCGSIDQIDAICQKLEEKKQDLITKNKELKAAAELVCQYIYENKTTKGSEASNVQTDLQRISVYEG